MGSFSVVQPISGESVPGLVRFKWARYLRLMESQVSSALRELCKITLKAYMDVSGEGAGTDMNGVLGILAEIGHNVYYATSREGAPGIPVVKKRLAELTMEAYVMPYGYDLLDAMEAEGVSRDFLFRLELAETIAERAYAAGFRPTVQVYGAD